VPNITTYDFLGKIASGMTTASSIRVQPSYNQDPDILLEKVKLDTTQDTNAFLHAVQADPNSFARVSLGIIRNGLLILTVFAKRDFDAAKRLEEIIGSFYFSEIGGIGRPPAKYILSELTVWQLEPIGGINLSAVRFSGKSNRKFYGIEQILAYSVARTTDIT